MNMFLHFCLAFMLLVIPCSQLPAQDNVVTGLGSDGPNWDDLFERPAPGPPYKPNPDEPPDSDPLGPPSHDADFGGDFGAAIASVIRFFADHPSSLLLLIVAGGSFLISAVKNS